MSCYNPSRYNPNCRPEPNAAEATTATPTLRLRAFGSSLLAGIGRRQAGRARFGRLLDAGWSRANKSAATPAHSAQ